MSLLDSPADAKPPSSNESFLKKVLPFTTVVLLVAAAYVAWTLYSRHESDLRLQRQIAGREQEARQRTVDQVFGGGEIKFSTFEAAAGSLKRGETTQLCYGVENATTVTMIPPVEPLKPTYRHCMDISPSKTTTYTITASDAKGHTESHSLTIHVN